MITSVLPNKYEGQTFTAIDQSSKLLIRYFVGVVTQIMIITIFVSLALSILGVKNALLIAGNIKSHTLTDIIKPYSDHKILGEVAIWALAQM